MWATRKVGNKPGNGEFFETEILKLGIFKIGDFFKTVNL